MPPFIAIAIAGAGIYAGLRWLTRELRHAASERASEPHGASASEVPGGRSGHNPKDLGTLEWDAAAGVYRPRKETAG